MLFKKNDEQLQSQKTSRPRKEHYKNSEKEPYKLYKIYEGKLIIDKVEFKDSIQLFFCSNIIFYTSYPKIKEISCEKKDLKVLFKYLVIFFT